MNGPLLHAWNHDRGSANRLAADIPDDTLALQPAPGMHHAARGLGWG